MTKLLGLPSKISLKALSKNEWLGGRAPPEESF
jgi:hypothetical protein